MQLKLFLKMFEIYPIFIVINWLLLTDIVTIATTVHCERSFFSLQSKICNASMRFIMFVYTSKTKQRSQVS